LSSPQGERIAVQPIVFHRVMDTVSMGEWQVVQEPDWLMVLLIGVQEASVEGTISESPQRERAAQGVVVPPVAVRHVQAIPKNPLGKTPLIIANLSLLR